MAAPRFTEPKTLEEAREQRYSLLETICKIRKQMTYPSRVNRSTGQQMTAEEFANWRKSAKLTMTHALKDFYRTDAWIARHLLSQTASTMRTIGLDVDLDANEAQALLAAEKFLDTQATC